MSKQKQNLISEAKEFLKDYLNEVSAAKSDEVCLFDMTIMPNESITKRYAFHDRSKFVSDITRHIIKLMNQRLIRNAHRPSKADLLLRCNSVVEMRDRYSNVVSHHSHNVIAVHPSLAHRVNQSLLEAIVCKNLFLVKSDVYFGAEPMLLSDVLSQTPYLQPIHLKRSIKRYEELDNLLDYHFKHYADASANRRNEHLKYEQINERKVDWEVTKISTIESSNNNEERCHRPFRVPDFRTPSDRSTDLQRFLV
jgi:hypothetical protein